ncbi:DUF502 domain-containing protein [Propionispora hippei]|uniref:Uncharacterized membrane protein n=1 Tax=Propionispora hippei DSM 15287 TaxID=1123003 RepID=A0A1M6AMY3_9FIRM|nr:DUF502 domain-containing protein [Propionispora hippei]SHI37836.1 Uncharacterized membrane protein [Propionispora hippei DSM 15287]
MNRISKYFINGLIVIVPIAITAFVVVQIFSMAEDLLGRHLPVHFPGIGIVTVVILLVVTGWLSSYWILKRLLEFGERLLDSIPIVKFIYKSIKQLSTAVFESQHLFKQAVLVPYPHPGAKSIGFIMSELSEPMAEALDGEHVCVYVPMSFNLTNGFNILVPKKDIIVLDITSESALQYIFTAGTIMPVRHDVQK